MLEIDHTWTSTGSTATWNTPVYLAGAALESALYVQASTIATTNSFQFQTAISSGGPWVAELSTAISADGNGGSLNVLRLTGPYLWMRPVTKTTSTGTYTVKLKNGEIYHAIEEKSLLFGNNGGTEKHGNNFKKD